MTNRPPRAPVRLRAFSQFFKNYMSLAAVVTASLPIPETPVLSLC